MLLEVEGLSKRYGGLAAVDGLTFSVKEGETLGIAGPNGAGKTTLFDVISGHAVPTSGSIRFAGEEIHRTPAHAICALGIARTFQVTVTFPELTVLGNVAVGAHFGRGTRWLGVRFDRATVDRAIESARFVGLGDRLDAPAGGLSLFDKKRLMIASALATEPRLLLLDEPVGGLTPAETDAILALVRGVRERGVTVLLIEHVMRALMSISDRVLIMNHGRLLFEGTTDDVVRDAEVIRVYLGTLPAEETPGDPALGEEAGDA